MAELVAVFMTIRGAGSYQGPTQTGMAGRMEALWTQFNIAGSAGSFDTQSWQQSPIFGGPSGYTASIVATGGGTVTCGQRVVIAASPSNALNYVWFKDNVPLDRPPEPNLVFDSVTLEDSGEYFCELELPGKSTVQTPALALTVKEAPSLPALSALATVLAIGIISLCGLALRAGGSQPSIRA